MSTDLKALVRRLLDDAEFRRAFVNGTDGTAGRSVSAEESRALTRMRARLATASGPEVQRVGPTTNWP